VKNANPSSENGIPMIGPANSMNRGHKSPSSNERRSGHGADREQDGGALGPTLGEIEIDGVPRHLPASLGQHHHERHGDPDSGKDDVNASETAI